MLLLEKLTEVEMSTNNFNYGQTVRVRDETRVDYMLMLS
jgi:hypothetical protein